MSTPNRQTERSSRSSEALLDAAAELIAEGGSGAMTFAAIGERAGYSRGLVTVRFGSKAGLVEALIGRVWGHLRDADVVPMSRTSPALSSLLGLVDGIHRAAVDNTRDMKAMVALLFEAPGPDRELRHRMAAFSENMRSEISDALARGLDDGSVRAGIDPDREAVLVAAALHGIAYQWLLAPDQVTLEHAYTTLANLIIDRYGAGVVPPG